MVYRKAYLEITNICNLSCHFCHGTKRPRKMMSEEEFELLTDRLAGEVEKLYFHLLGEPLLHPLLGQFVRRAREKGFQPLLTTNGTLLAKRGEELLENPPHKVNISLHSAAANPAFENPRYLEDCMDFAEKAAERGVIVVFRLWNVGGKGEVENAAIIERLHQKFKEEWKPSRGGYRLSSKTLFLEWGEEFEWPDESAPEAPVDTRLFCHGLRDQVGILCDGTVVPCCLDADGCLALGNLFETPFRDIVKTPLARNIYNGFSGYRARERFCRKCGYAKKYTERK